MNTVSSHAQESNSSSKYCPGCKQTLDATRFNRDRQGHDGLSRLCKNCRKAYRKAHPEKRNPCLVVTKTHKYCPGCRQTLEASHFNKNRTQPDGLAPHCRACRSEVNKAAYPNAKGVQTERYHRYYPQNKTAYRERNKRWRAIESNREREAELRREHQRTPHYREKRVQWRLAHPEINHVIHSRRRARKAQSGGSFTSAEWKQLLEFYDYTCLRCGKREPEIKLTADHVLPLFLGGSSNIDNIQPLCKVCNASKGTKHIDYRLRGENII